MKKIAIIHGPNLNLLGAREKEFYGELTLDQINNNLISLAKNLNMELEILQSNLEGELVNFIQSLKGRCDGLVINAGGYTHTSVAIRDALIATQLRFIEVHLSNLDKREEFRKTSVLSDLACGVISGFGGLSYELGLMAFDAMIF